MSSILSLRNISKSYKDGKEKRTILDSLDFTVNAGEFVAVLGPSGSGKSTFLSIAGLLMTPDSGSVFIHGQDMTALKKKLWTKQRREHIGFIFQNHQLLPYLKVQDQLGVTNKNLSSSRKEELLKELGIFEVRKQYPVQLSGGERQRTAIARAFASNQSLILADEPTASLDANRGRQVVEMIRHQVKKEQKAAVMVTHDERVLDLVDRVYRLENNKLISD
ncbi:MAG TPA: ABC transporter ATP-binding protein [Lachnospiraceae bacterium]